MAAPLSATPAAGTIATIPERAIRRDIPLTNSIRRAFAAGTRDSSGRPGARYWQLWMDYKINVRLDPATSTVSGREIATIHNRSESTLTSVALRLEQNILGPTAARLSSPTEATDGMRITRLALNGVALNVADTTRAVIPGSRRRGRPLSQILRERTVVLLPLPTPIAPRGTGTVEAEWSFRVPPVDANTRGDRGGSWGDSLYQVAYWYPKVTVYDDLRAGGWDTEPYLGPSEFYHNFGRYDVSIDVPAGWIVGATGVLQNPGDVLTPAARQRLSRVLDSDSVRSIVSATERGPGNATRAGNRLVWRFVADTANDFAFGTAKDFVWDATRATIPGRGPVPVHILYLPGHTTQYSSVGAIGRHALQFYSGLLGPYLFPQLTFVDGPEGGMEYPMFLMSGAGAADHEVAHQWWPMMVGVNETWYAFMDEGFNQYVNILSEADANRVPPRLNGLGQSYGRVSGEEREAPQMWNANYGGPMYGFQAYQKAPMMLSSLGGIVGDTAVQQALGDFTRAWIFKHPSPWDFAFFMNNALKRDLGWFWYYWLFTTESVDGSIENVSTAGSRTTVTVRQAGQMPSPVVLRVQFASTGPNVRLMANSRMLDTNSALVTYPVDVWFNGSRTFDAALDFGGRAIERITLDPEGRFPDRDTRDNFWPRRVVRATGATGNPR
ncbi:MAG TPA: M1 family metallopeptidase [Gemmatimonadaceae bacterium]|nr:M1 family metallopeptidase [Gemmatimonadaceae bacterium]